MANKKYLIKSRVKVGAEYLAPEDGKALVVELEPKVAESLLAQKAVEEFVEVAPKAASKKDEK